MNSEEEPTDTGKKISNVSLLEVVMIVLVIATLTTFFLIVLF